MDYKLSKLAIGLAAVLAFSAQANAATYSLNYSDLTSDYENIVSGIQGSFSDTYTFTLPVASDIGASLSSNNFTLKAKVVSNISDLTEILYNGSNVQLYTNFGTFQNAIGTLGAGSYSFVISGMGSGSKGGNYTLDAAAQPVPEPTESALMLSGIAMLGFIAARRKSV